MKQISQQKVLISGAGIAGISTAWWMNKTGYKVTVVEMAPLFRTGGAAVDIRGAAIDVVKRMDIYEQLKAACLSVDQIELRNTDDIIESLIVLNEASGQPQEDHIEIERDKFFDIVYAAMQGEVEFIFNNKIIGLSENEEGITATFEHGPESEYDLVLGCDGMHSGIRKIWFGPESDYACFLEAYFSITIVNKLLIQQKTMRTYSMPGKAVMLNAYNHKTDIIFCFVSEKEISYEYKNVRQQQAIIAGHFASAGRRIAALLEEVKQPENFYFDKFCQIKMPFWSKGRVVLVGDAAYCASPAAGMGGSLAVMGAAALADALQKHKGAPEPAFRDYDKNLRPFIEEVHANAFQNLRENFLPRTEEAINRRNREMTSF